MSPNSSIFFSQPPLQGPLIPKGQRGIVREPITREQTADAPVQGSIQACLTVNSHETHLPVSNFPVDYLWVSQQSEDRLDHYLAGFSEASREN